jgi:hypothetical protein
MLPAAEVTAMRAAATSSFPDTVAISRPGSTLDAEGNPVKTLAAVATVAGWLKAGDGQADATEAGTGGEAAQEILARLLLPQGTAVRPGDLAVIGGTTWRVLTVADHRFHVRCAVAVADR